MSGDINKLGLENKINFQELIFGLSHQVEYSNKSRLLIVIDALNESLENLIWRKNLKDFIETVIQYDNIAVCVSCTKILCKDIIDKNIYNFNESYENQKVVNIELRGFYTLDEQKYTIKKYILDQGKLYSATWLPSILKNPLLLSLHAKSIKGNTCDLNEESIYVLDILTQYCSYVENKIQSDISAISSFVKDFVFKTSKDIAKEILKNSDFVIPVKKGREICKKYFDCMQDIWIDYLIRYNLLIRFENQYGEQVLRLNFTLIQIFINKIIINFKII